MTIAELEKMWSAFADIVLIFGIGLMKNCQMESLNMQFKF